VKIITVDRSRKEILNGFFGGGPGERGIIVRRKKERDRGKNEGFSFPGSERDSQLGIRVTARIDGCRGGEPYAGRKPLRVRIHIGWSSGSFETP